ncbi:MAG TPA: uroporphyrinogen decarboxylase family protein [Candidatus Hydrogenedentes bacterium]|nr:uroporphyrinogen decarboxylase family protein [Candidatus Hydrogenedentota bacterium]HPG67338.1 uroporphyrinogen decarboxylase family protein [Candidatus Hydrogenedentota bacterium]
MTGKERVIAALRREKADRVPIFMWFQPSTVRRLAEALEIAPNRVVEALGDDVRQAWVNNNYAMEGIRHAREGEGHVDAWGIAWRRQGEFNQIVSFPLEKASPDEILGYRFPVDAEDGLLDQMVPVMEWRDAYFCGVDVSPCVFEMYNRLRGMEGALLDLRADEAVAFEMMGRCADFAVDLSHRACDRFDVDWLWTGDDVAGQQALFMSPEMWRRLVKPHLERVVDVGIARGLPVAYHSCGAIRDIIGDLIEIGVDVLNPIQCNCPGMEAADLKREFGDLLTFMGGVDTQGLLPSGTANEVRRATATLIETMTSDGGGCILAASHTVPPETPLDNIFAMYDEAGVATEEILDRAAAIRARLP